MRKTPATEELSDRDLLQLSKKGNEEAFLILYHRHQGPVFRFALHMSGRRETAEEVTQETFMTLLSERYDENRGALQGYLIGVARNQVRLHLTRNRTWPAEAIAEPRRPETELLSHLTKEQEVGALRNAILRLPPNYREVIVLCDLEGVPYAQAAQQLGCAIGTVRSRLYRARAILGAKLRSRERCPV